MKTKQLLPLLVTVLLPTLAGCGSLKELCFGLGAPCGSCATMAPGYPLGSSIYQGPLEGGCGGEPMIEYGCGGETFGSYYGGIPSDASVIDSSGAGMGHFDPSWSNPHIPGDWRPSGEMIVPNSMRYSDGPPANVPSAPSIPQSSAPAPLRPIPSST